MWNLALGLVCFVAGFLLLRRSGSVWAAAGGARFVEKYLARPGAAFVVAILATGLLHSSSAFLALLVGLSGSGRVPTAAALGAILGANVGTTTTAQLASLPTPKMLFILLGLGLFLVGQLYRHVLWLVSRSGRTKAGTASSPATFGLLLFGLGLLLLGLEKLGSAARFASWPPLARLLIAAQASPLAGVLTGTLVSALIQSSTLLVGILMGLVAAGKLGLPGAVAVIVGANVGTTADVLVVALGAPAPARRVAVGHLLLNIAGAVLFVIFPGVLVRLVVRQSPQRAVAWSHTLFNLSGILFWPLLPSMARLLEILVPDNGKER